MRPNSRKSACVHSVHIYERDCDLMSRLCAVTSTSLRLGDAVLIVATPEHRDDLVRSLVDTGVNVRQCVREGRYVMLDAREALSTFMHEGWPDRNRFVSAMGSTLDAVRRRAQNGSYAMTVFGEMVAILWYAGKKEAALELERLWNEVISERGFHLHCAYPRNLFQNEEEIYAVHAVHTHVMPESSAA
ncbi:MAG: MEDS domain-containing protein [Terriglobales bacterium]